MWISILGLQSGWRGCWSTVNTSRSTMSGHDAVEGKHKELNIYSPGSSSVAGARQQNVTLDTNNEPKVKSQTIQGVGILT